ncbi:MAG: Na+/H+ antiporter NhaA [Cellulosilyticaceae bacterium]
MRCFPGLLLIVATLISLVIANSPLGESYHHVLDEINLFGHFNLHMIVNDFFMAIFFLLVGLEIKHEIMHGHLSSIKKASFPVIAAFGGVIVPALIFTFFNAGTQFAHGVGVPISTDIAFAVGIFMLLKNKLNPSLKIFLLSLAVVDDLISILVIGVLYSSDINVIYLSLAILSLIVLFIMNKKFNVSAVTPYLLVGLLLWSFIYLSGVHATISGVLLAIAIPTVPQKGAKESMATHLEHALSPVCNLLILPLFALVNTAISLSGGSSTQSADTMALGIIAGLTIGKPLGIMLFTYIASKLGLTEKPAEASWLCIFSVSLLAGIGFTMSIFVAEIAFAATPQFINIAKLSILGASIISIMTTYVMASVLAKRTQSHLQYVKRNITLN